MYYGNLTVYANVGHVNTGVGDLTIYGDVIRGLRLGDHQSAASSSNVKVSGNVGNIEWYVRSIRPDSTFEYYVGFDGSVTVDGRVAQGAAYSVVYDEVLETNTWQKTREIAACEAGVFRMNQGVLDENIGVTELDPMLGKYVYQYQCSYLGDDYSKTYWTKQAYHVDNYQFATQWECGIEDIPEGAKVIVYSVAPNDPITFGVDLGDLTIYAERNDSGGIVVNGNVKALSVYMKVNTGCTTVINGDVETLNVDYKYNCDNNLWVTGKVKSGRAIRTDRNICKDIGWFECENLQIVVDGNWNQKMIMRTSGVVVRK